MAAALLGLVALPGMAAASAPAATSPAPVSSASVDPGGYPAQSPLLTVTSGTVKVGGSVTVSGQGFQGGEVIDISVTYGPANHALGSGGPTAQPVAFTLHHGVVQPAAIAHAVATPAGAFSARVPLTQAGNATITAVGEQSHMSVVATVSVLSATSVAAAKSTKHTLPLSKIELVALGLVVLVALVAAELAWKRSRMPSAEQHDVSTA
ncbi:MAG TPA: hypothetical protein VGL75_16965 [Acidothermaceae bacterium]